MLYKKIVGKSFIISALLARYVSAFSISLFSPGFDITAGSSSMFVFEGDSPKLVTFKIAVQNKDNSLTAIESLSAPNTTPGSFVRINIPSSVEPGINYWFIAVDSANELNYATMGPRVIREMFDTNNPTASITADSGSAYKTDGGQIAVSATKTTSNATPTDPVAFPTELFPSGLFPSDLFPNGYPTGFPTSKSTSTSTDNHGSGLSTGAIIGIAVGGFAFVCIMLCVFYCCCIRKAIKTFTPIVNNLARPNNMKNESSLPIVSTPTAAANTQNIHEISVLPPVTLAKPQNHEVPITPSPQMTPSSTVATPNTTEYSFNASNENMYNQYPPTTHNQQSYPSYPYPYNPNSPPQTFQYPSQDYMPKPEHFNGGVQLYPPLSPTIQNNNTYSFQQQQPYFNYGNEQNWETRPSESTIGPVAESNTFVYPPMAPGIIGNQTNKTEHVPIPIASTVFNQKVEYHDTASDKAEYNQKPDTTEYNQNPDTAEYNQKPDEPAVYNKPNNADVQQYNKPHEREV